MIGGLRLIKRQAFIDVTTILLLATAHFLPDLYTQSIALGSACILAYSTSGHTKRWTITFPMIPIVALHLLQYLIWCYNADLIEKNRTIWWVVNIPSLLLVCIAAALTILFPAVEIPPVKNAVYGVGVMDFYVPMEIRLDDGSTVKRHLPARLMYPTEKKYQGEIPYLNEKCVDEFCFSTMKFGAPDLLKQHHWMLHTWKIAKLQAARDAPPSESIDSVPFVVYSHGLGGCIDIYMYQPMALTARLGAVVLTVTHMDGSAACIPLSSGDVVVREHIPDKGAVYTRRKQTEIRIQELLNAANYVLEAKTTPTSPFHKVMANASSKAFFMGHSFGATTVLAAADRCPDLTSGVIAHEPVADWMPDEARESLFSKERIAGLKATSETTPGQENVERRGQTSVHDQHILVMNSQEWTEKEWGLASLIQEMSEKKRLGRKETSKHIVVSESRHMEFSDLGMMNPNWLSRAVGMVGPRRPQETAEEISMHTIEFIQGVHNKTTTTKM